MCRLVVCGVWTGALGPPACAAAAVEHDKSLGRFDVGVLDWHMPRYQFRGAKANRYIMSCTQVIGHLAVLTGKAGRLLAQTHST